MKLLRTGDQSLVKKINKSIVFQTIKNRGPISRAQVAKETGLNKATVSTMVAELIKESFVQEIGAGKSSGGRKPVMLYFNHTAGYSIGIDLGVNYVLGVLTDLSGNIIEQTTIGLHSLRVDNVTENIFSVIEKLIRNTPESQYGVIGIGVGAPGQIDPDEKIQFAPNLKWKDVDLKRIIEERFSIPTFIENEANAGAYGEQLHGAGQNLPNQIYISIGIGIGTGIVINNQLYKGSSGISGEMGHFTIDSSGRRCSCGNRGCWELYASESAFINMAKQHNVLNEDVDVEFELDYLFEEAQKGNGEVLQLLNILGEYTGVGITNIINTFNPDAIIIGNRMARFKNWLINPIDRILEERLSVYHHQNTEIRFSTLDNLSTALGATSIAITYFFSENKITKV
ncbi:MULTISPECIES: ROK family transcriptional regulator [unclassified Oceanobacillus]|uniref:ROK family transcriptional regulator n=1 Tax=unclassified Oceanobacillus TaxID=2630292 RepID=UPI00300DC6C1